jgi:hypothetical protein
VKRIDQKLSNIQKAKVESVPDRLCDGLPAEFREYFDRLLQCNDATTRRFGRLSFGYNSKRSKASVVRSAEWRVLCFALLCLGFIWFGLVAGSTVLRDRSADVEFAEQFEYGGFTTFMRIAKI